MKRGNGGNSKWIIITLLAGSSLSLFADGYRNPPMTARSLAKSHACYVFTDDASAIQYNPANLAFQDQISLVYGMTIPRSENTFINTNGTEAVSDADWQILPNLFIASPIGTSGLSAGLGVSTPFGQGVRYDKNSLPNNFIYEAQMIVANINPTVAYRVSDRLSIGAGVDLYLSSLMLKQRVEVIPGVVQDAETEMTGASLGGNLAITYNVTDRQRLGLTYRSGFEVEYDGDLTVQGVGPLVNSDASSEINFPNIIGIGYGIALTDSIRMEAAFEWLEWSANDSQTMQMGANGSQTVPQQWDNTTTFQLSGEWDWSEYMTVLAGYSYLESPIPNKTASPILPDLDRHVLSVGFVCTFDRHQYGLAYAHSIYQARDIPEAIGGMNAGRYETQSNLLNFTYAYSF